MLNLFSSFCNVCLCILSFHMWPIEPIFEINDLIYFCNQSYPFIKLYYFTINTMCIQIVIL